MSDERCEICAEIATVECSALIDGGRHFFCRQHSPLRKQGGQSAEFELLRFRLPPENQLSELLASPVTSPGHQSLRIELCDMRLLGDDGACRYYLSRLNGVDYFTAWNDVISEALRQFAIARFGNAASRFCVDEMGAPMVFVAALRRAHAAHFAEPASPRESKEEIAIEILLRHPDWSDDCIAQAAGTTPKQLRRFGTYSYARVIGRRGSPS